MNTRDVATEYRLAHWAGVMREREESGLSIKAFSEKSGFHENRYFYWQKKLRELACEELAKIQGKATELSAPPVLAEFKLPMQSSLLPPTAGISQNSICVEAGGMRLTAGCDYPIDKLVELLRVVSRECF